MTFNQFEKTLLYSHKNIEKLARKLVNESSNAVIIEMFDDACYLADHVTGQIYESKYSFDGKVFTFSDFKKIKLEKDESPIREAIQSYLDDENINLCEAYENAVSSNSTIFDESITSAIASKNVSDMVDYTELVGINEEIGDLKKTSLFKAYEERLDKLPTDRIKAFNWNDPVKVSLIDEDTARVINKSTKAKAKLLKKSIEFKNRLAEAALESVNGDNSMLESLIRENKAILALDRAGIKELVGLSVITNRQLIENRNSIVDTIESLISEDEDLLNKREVLLSEEEGEEEASVGAEASEEDVEELKKALEKAKDKVTDDKLLSKIDELIGAIESSSEEGETDVGAVKESIELLKL